MSEPPEEGWPEPAETVEQPAAARPSQVVFEESAATRPPRGWDDIAGWLLAALFLAAALIFLFLWLSNRDSTPAVAPASQGTVAVPAVTGMTLQAATSALQAAQLTAQAQQQQSSKPAGTVISQSPASGERVAKGAMVTLAVARGKGTSSGGGQVAVPSLVGMTESDAVTALQSAGFVPSVKQVASTQTRGAVIGQAPTSGTKAAKGSNVSINVSNGPTATSQTRTQTAPGSTVVRTVTVSQTRTVTTTETVTTVQTVTQPPP